MRISNRKLLEGLFRENSLKKVDKIKKAVRVIDDIEKVDKTTLQRLDELGISIENAENILSLLKNCMNVLPAMQ